MALAAIATPLPSALRGTIRVPADRRDMPIEGLLLSWRVESVLAREGYRLVGDLDGLAFGVLAKLRGLGLRGLAELREQLLGLGAVDAPTPPSGTWQTRDPLDPAGARALARQRRMNRIEVPAARRELLFESFPISTRLTNALLASGWRRLGDLDGLCMSEIADRHGFGVLTLAELYDFLVGLDAVAPA